MKRDTGTYNKVQRVSQTHTNITTNNQDGINGPWRQWRKNKHAAALRAFKARG